MSEDEVRKNAQDKLFGAYIQFTLDFVWFTGTAHCANMYEPKPTDFPQLKLARQKILAFLQALVGVEN